MAIAGQTWKQSHLQEKEMIIESAIAVEQTILDRRLEVNRIDLKVHRAIRNVVVQTKRGMSEHHLIERIDRTLLQKENDQDLQLRALDRIDQIALRARQDLQADQVITEAQMDVQVDDLQEAKMHI